MKRFIDKTNTVAVTSAIYYAERLLTAGSPMMLELEAKNDWKYNSGTGKEVVEKLLWCTKVPEVRLYKPWNHWSKVIGYTDGKNIYINARKLPSMSYQDVVGNLCHEFSHLAGLSHGNNYKTEDKVRFSVPYFISENISRWL